MSLDTDVAQLTGSANALIDIFNNKSADIESRVVDALKAIPDNYKKLVVDQVNGDDNNSGINAENALKSISEAINRTPTGGALLVSLITDYTMTESIDCFNKWIRITSSSAEYRNFTFTAESVGNELRVAGFVCWFSGGIHMEKLNIYLPDISGEAGQVGLRSSCFGPRESGHATSFELKITYSEIFKPDQAPPMIYTAVSRFFLGLVSTTYPTSMAGNWIRGISADTPVSSLEYVTSSGIDIL